MHKSDKIESVTFDLIADVVGKWPTVFAGKAVRSDMIAAFPADDRPNGVFDPFVKIGCRVCLRC